MPKIVKVCDYCGQEKEVYLGHSVGKRFFTCSKKCKDVMLSQYLKKSWDILTPEEREERICNQQLNRKTPVGKGLNEFWKEHNARMLDHTINMMKDHKGIVSVQERTEMKISLSPCVLLKAHAAVMKDDPERLTTKFCQKLMGIKCNTDDENEKNLQQVQSKESTQIRSYGYTSVIEGSDRKWGNSQPLT